MAQRMVGQLITRKEAVTLGMEASVREASRIMTEHRVGAILVLSEAGALEGIFTERDALNRVLAEGRDPDATTLREVMTGNPVTIGRASSAVDALRLMTEVGFRHLPVVDEEGLSGVISIRDFVGAELQQAGRERDG